MKNKRNLILASNIKAERARKSFAAEIKNHSVECCKRSHKQGERSKLPLKAVYNKQHNETCQCAAENKHH